MLHIKGITYRVGERALFEGASAHVPAGKRIGLVGANGSGKTTLIRLITGEAELDGGAIDVRSRCTVGTVAQEAPSGKSTPLATVLAADTERNDLLEEASRSADSDRIAAVHTRLADIDAHSAPARAAVILSGLGFDEEMQARPIDSLSGGWKMRVALGSALFSEPDLLLLDEPTNHLDLESVIWLQGYLRGYPGTLVVVSHDRELLNTVAQSTMLVENGKLSVYTGGYDEFIRVRAAQAAVEEAGRVKMEAQRKHLQSFVDRFRAKASKAKQAQSRVKMLERLEVTGPLSSGSVSVRFSFPDPVDRPSPLVKLDGVSAWYDPGSPVLEDLHLSIFSEDRIALLGANGNGKTTLARLLANEIVPGEGQVVPAIKLKVGYFAQDHLERLNENITALEQMKAAMSDDSLDKVRGWLGRFGFVQSRAEVMVKGLSGGEKTRLALALLALTRPNLMILDEPTNHLDMDAREALVQGLNQFGGSIILISHDRRLIEATVDQLWLVADGTCKQFFGDLEDYNRTLLQQRKSMRRARREESEGATQRVSRKDARKSAADERARMAPLKKAAEAAEAMLEKLTAEKDELDSRLSDPSVYEGPSDEIVPLTRRQRELEDLLTQAEERWLEAQEMLEEARADVD